MSVRYWHVHIPDLPAYGWSRDCRLRPAGCPDGAFAHLLVNGGGVCWGMRASTCPAADAACRP